ncbi:MAG: conjugal transfer protein TraG, partial [Peptostreptococcaceae bacterium]
MANKKMPDKTVNTVKLDIGKSGNDKDIYICSKARYLNTLTIGSKGTGKSSFIMPTFIAQDLKNKNLGLTIITSRKDMSYYIQAMANDEKRKITLIKPTLNPNIENRLFDGLMEIKQIEESSGFSGGALYDLVNEDFINYKNAIKRKHIVVIDMENLQYGDQSVEAVLLFLKQLEIDIQETKVTNKTNHFVYIDDANYYLKGLTNLLEFGNEYNLGFNLFIRSRSQLVVNGVDYRSLIDDNIRTTILLNSLNQDDIDFYSKRFTNLNIDFYNRDANSVVYDSINSNFKRISGVSSLPISDENYINNLNLVSAKRKNKLIKKRDKDNENKKKELLRETAIDS